MGDFWRMVWDQRANVVVMVNDEEKDKPVRIESILRIVRTTHCLWKTSPSHQGSSLFPGRLASALRDVTRVIYAESKHCVYFDQIEIGILLRLTCLLPLRVTSCSRIGFLCGIAMRLPRIQGMFVSGFEILHENPFSFVTWLLALFLSVELGPSSCKGHLLLALV